MKHKRIMEEITKIFGKNSFTVTGWQNYQHSEVSINKLSKIINDCCISAIPRPNMMIRKNLIFSVIERDKTYSVWRKEEALERIITLINDKAGIYNQFPLNKNNSKENIDLIKETNSMIKSLIELKFDQGGGTPLFALVEIIKNLILFRKYFAEDSTVESLLIVAPEFYYNYYSRNSNFTDFMNSIDLLSNKYKTSILFKKIKITNPSFLDDSLSKLNKSAKIEWKKSSNSRFSKIAKIDANSIVTYLNKAELEALKFDNWETVMKL